MVESPRLAANIDEYLSAELRSNDSVQSQQSPPRPPAARPTCTHVNMDKVFAGHSCQLCHRTPSIGWVYACQQDHSAPRILKLANKTRKKLLKGRRRTSTELELLGFNKSIVKAAENGFYTREQLNVLKGQKHHLKATIESAQKENEVMKSKHGPSAAVLSGKLAALDIHQTRESDDIQPAALKEDKAQAQQKSRLVKPIQPCDFKVCHTCRPFSRDRSFVSFESVFNGEIETPNAWSEQFMPVADAKVVRNIGLRTPPHEPALQEAEEYDNAYAVTEGNLQTSAASISDNPSLELRNSQASNYLRGKSSHSNLREQYAERTESRGFRSSLKKALHEMIRRKIESSTTGTDANFDEDMEELFQLLEDDEDFDLDLWKAMTEDLLEKAASTKLPGSDGEDHLEDTIQDHGPQAGVRKGVALTEEALETRTPDIIISV